MEITGVGLNGLVTPLSTTEENVSIRFAAIGLGVIAALAALLLGYGYARHRTRSASAWDVFTDSQLSPYTPQYQDGMSLTQIDRVQDGAFPRSTAEMLSINDPTGDAVGLFITLPGLPSRAVPDGCGFQDGVCGGLLSITGTTSAGDTQRLPWRMLVPESDRMIFCRIPAGYSAGTRFVDVTVTDWFQHTATWRVIGLPRTRRVIFRPPVVTATNDDLSVDAHAGFVSPSDPASGQPAPLLLVDLHITGPSYSPRVLSCQIDQCGAEWSPTGLPIFLADTPADSPYFATHHHAVDTVRTGWPAANHRIHVSGRAVAYDKFDESVVFHDVTLVVERPDRGDGAGPMGHLSVASDQSVVTPSGVQVTLPSQDSPNPTGVGISCDLVWAHNSQVVLPASPLYHWHQQPIDRIVAAFAAPLSAVSETSHYEKATSAVAAPPVRTTVTFRWPGAVAGPLQELPVILRQELQTSACPFDLWVPVTRDYQGPVGPITPVKQRR